MMIPGSATNPAPPSGRAEKKGPAPVCALSPSRAFQVLTHKRERPDVGASKKDENYQSEYKKHGILTKEQHQHPDNTPPGRCRVLFNRAQKQQTVWEENRIFLPGPS